MLVQVRGGAEGPKSLEDEEKCSDFQAALRRDLAGAPMFLYDSVLGGWVKRGADIVLTLALAPIWLTALLAMALWLKLRDVSPIFVSDERIGYGGETFACYRLGQEVDRADANPVAALLAAGEGEEEGNVVTKVVTLAQAAPKAESRRSKWVRVLKRLPQLFNVLRGEMSLVGPLPIAREELDHLKGARRYYLSARPGLAGIGALVGPNDEPSSQYKIYSMVWSPLTDALLVWESLSMLRARGELWRPRFRQAAASLKAEVRRRAGPETFS